MLRLPLIAASLVALALPLDARAGDVFAFSRASAQPNERVHVRAETPRPVRLYLVPAAAAAVAVPTDRRLTFIGSLAPDRRDRGSLTFSVPPLDAGVYRLAVWCRTCGDGRFSVQRSVRLRVLPTASCPVTRPNGNRPPRQPRSVNWYGNGLLWARVEGDGSYSVPREQVAADGSIGNKLLWVTTPPWSKPAVTGERLDAAAPPLKVLGVNTGSFQGDVDPSHMTPVSFPSPGCWRLTARIADVSLVYVVQVAVADG